MRVLVTGAEGQLARSIACCVMSAAGEDEYLFAGRRELDITDLAAVLDYVTTQRIDIIVNCAAYTDVERAESEEEVAYAVNALGAKNLAEAAKQSNALLIHISTDFVFMGGCCQRLDENAHPQPLNAYGRTKLAGEEAVQASGCHHIILRTAWLYSEFGNNFLTKIAARAATNAQLCVVDDQYGSPTYARDLAASIVQIIGEEKFHEGLYHFTNLGECSRWEQAKAICEALGLQTEVKPCRTIDFPTKAVRPNNCVLDKSKFQRTFGIAIPEWRDALKRCINEL